MTSIIRTVVHGLAVIGGAAVIALGTAGTASAGALPAPPSVAELPITPSVSGLTITPDDGAAPVVVRLAAGNEYLTLTAGPTGRLRVTADIEPMNGADVVANDSGVDVTVQITHGGVVEHDVPVGNGARCRFSA